MKQVGGNAEDKSLGYARMDERANEQVLLITLMLCTNLFLFWFIPRCLIPTKSTASIFCPPLAQQLSCGLCGLSTCCAGPQCLFFSAGCHSQEHGGPGTLVLVPRIFLLLSALLALQGPHLQGSLLSLFIKAFLLALCVSKAAALGLDNVKILPGQGANEGLKPSYMYFKVECLERPCLKTH